MQLTDQGSLLINWRVIYSTYICTSLPWSPCPQAKRLSTQCLLMLSISSSHSSARRNIKSSISETSILGIVADVCCFRAAELIMETVFGPAGSKLMPTASHRNWKWNTITGSNLSWYMLYMWAISCMDSGATQELSLCVPDPGSHDQVIWVHNSYMVSTPLSKQYDIGMINNDHKVFTLSC